MSADLKHFNPSSEFEAALAETRAKRMEKLKAILAQFSVGQAAGRRALEQGRLPRPQIEKDLIKIIEPRLEPKEKIEIRKFEQKNPIESFPDLPQPREKRPEETHFIIMDGKVIAYPGKRMTAAELERFVSTLRNFTPKR